MDKKETAKMEKRKYKTRISRQTKVETVLSLLRGDSIEELSRIAKVGVHEVNSWKETFLSHGELGFKKAANKPNRDSELERIIGRQHIEIELLKKKMQPYGKTPENM
jgi:transposase